MASYLLTCSCGKTVPVEPGQAGGQVVCSCGTSLDVPTLRQLRHLPPAPSHETTEKRAWSIRKGAVAFFLIAAGLLASVALWNRLSEPEVPEFQPLAQAERVEHDLKTLTPLDAWKTWILVYRPLAEHGFVPMQNRNEPAIRAAIARNRFLQATMLSIAGVCLALSALIAFWPAAKGGTPRRP